MGKRKKEIGDLPAGVDRAAIEKAHEEGAKGKKAKAPVPEGLSAEKASKRIVRAYGKWEAATAQLHEIAKATGEKLKAAEASFREQIEAGVSVRSEAEAKKKLNAVTGSWQELQETIAANIEERKHAKEERKKAAKALERAVEEARQLPLFADD